MGTCRHCNSTNITISDLIGFCADCIREHFDSLWTEIKAVHDKSRESVGLPRDPPQAEDGARCTLCFHRCRIPENGTGYCGIRRAEQGKLKGGLPHEGNLAYYHDPLPTNCVADFVCPAGGGSGYPVYSVTKGPEYGYNNLAVFYHACSFNCLYCQNYHFKYRTFSPTPVTAEQLANAALETTSCICYFGGDPSPQVLHALKASTLARENAGNRILRICWETNGATSRPLLGRMAELSLESGGCIKFDLKAWHDGIHHALCGVSNLTTVENFEWLSQLIARRPEPPFLIASTLLVPGYVDVEEVAPIARFLADLNPDIPYRMLAFHPDYYLTDLPRTSKVHALRCKEVAQDEGLKLVSVGNLHLLGDRYP